MIFSQTKQTPIETHKKMTNSKNMKNAKKKKEGTKKKNRKKGNDAKKKKTMEDGGKRVVAEAKMNKDGGNASVSLNA